MSIIRNGFESADLDVPVVLPTLNLDFANSQSLDKRITFSRGSIGTRVNRNGLIETIAANQPRFDFDPISGECRGLLIEESRTNLITSSNNFGGGTVDLGVIASATVSPDGTTNASLIFEKTTNNFKLYTAGVTSVIGTTYCGSVFVKYAGSSKYGRLKSGSTNTIIINLTNGSILSSTGTCGVIPYSNGWYRIYSIFTATTTSENLQLFLMNYNGALSQYQGDGSSGYYVYGMQAEVGAFATSYIPTSASTVTRSADNASMTGTNFSSWYNQSEGTFYSNVKSTTGVGGYIISARGTSGGDRHQLTQLGGATVISNVVVATFPKTYNSQNKQAYSYSTNNFSFVTDKDKITQKFSGAIPTNILYATVGRADFGGLNPINGTISRLTYYPIQLTSNQLINLTS